MGPTNTIFGAMVPLHRDTFGSTVDGVRQVGRPGVRSWNAPVAMLHGLGTVRTGPFFSLGRIPNFQLSAIEKIMLKNVQISQ